MNIVFDIWRICAFIGCTNVKVIDPGRVVSARMERETRMQKDRPQAFFSKNKRRRFYIIYGMRCSSKAFDSIRSQHILVSERSRSKMPVYYFTQWPLWECMRSCNVWYDEHEWLQDHLTSDGTHDAEMTMLASSILLILED